MGHNYAAGFEVEERFVLKNLKILLLYDIDMTEDINEETTQLLFF